MRLWLRRVRGARRGKPRRQRAAASRRTPHRAFGSDSLLQRHTTFDGRIRALHAELSEARLIPMRKLFLAVMTLIALAAAPLLIPRAALGEQPQDFSKVEIKVTKVSAVDYFENCEKAIFLKAKIPLPMPPSMPTGSPTTIVRRPPAISPGSPRKMLTRTRGTNRQTRNITQPITMATRRRSANFT